ncbi:MAG TPA: hypothetical protein VFF43_13605 [Caldimonas sp.]|nr:hypothetical protein [Caldimonas sp.]
MKRAVAVVVATVCVVFVGAADAADAPRTKILTCRDAQGRPLITDPSDPRCYTPPLTPDEVAKQEAEYNEQMEKYRECMALQRSDQTLLSRYPNKAKHDAARQAALAEIETTLKISQSRLDQLLAERQRLRNEAEFYPNGNLPAKLKRDIDSNTALIDAQTEAIAGQKDNAAQKTAFYDGELARLKMLWQSGPGRSCVQPRIVKKEEKAR